MTRAMYGEDNPQAKLTDREADLLVGAYRDMLEAEGRPTKTRIYQTLGARFGLRPGTVKAICSGKRRLNVDRAERLG